MAVDHTFKWSGFARGLSDSFAQAMQRRLEQQYRQDSQVDLLSYLPDQVRQTLYPDRQSLPVDPSQVSPLMGHTMSAYDRVSRPQESQMPMGALVAYQQAVQSGNWEPFLESWGHLNVPSSDMARLAMMPQYTATAVQRGVETQGMQSQLAWEDTPLTEYQAAMLGMPQWAGIPPRQLQGMQHLQSGIRDQERHESDLLTAALERVYKDLGIQKTQSDMARDAIMFEPLLRQAQAQASQAEFDVRTQARRFDMDMAMAEQSIRSMAAQQGYNEAQTEELLRLLPYVVEQYQIENQLRDLDRVYKGLNIQATQDQMARDAQIFPYLLQQVMAQAEKAQFEADTEAERFNLWLQLGYQELDNMALQGQIDQLEYQRMQLALPYYVRQEAARAGTMESEARRSQIETDLLATFGRQKEQLAIQAAELGIALDEASLDRLIQTTGPVVAKAVAEASLAQTEAQTQEALAPVVIEQATAELENRRLQNQIDSVEYEAAVQLLPIQVEQALENLQTSRVRRQSEELQLELAREFDQRFKIEGLKSLELNNLRQAVGLELDQAELERYVRLTDPIVQKAVAEAVTADTEALFRQETYEAMVAQVEAELQEQLTANKLSEQEYELALQLAPYRVQQAVEDLLKIQLQNEAQELENQYAREALPFRFNQLVEQTMQLQMESSQLSTQIQLLQTQLAMAQRTGDTQAQLLETELEIAKLRQKQLQAEINQAEKATATLQSLDPSDRDFVFKMYQAEIEPFRNQGVWIPPFADYVTNMMSREQPMDWNHYVWNYDAEMRQRIGPPPEGDALDFPWMSQEWQSLYKKELDGYIATLPDRQWSLRQAPVFPSMAVFYGNLMSKSPMTPDELIRRYNDGTIPQYIYDIAFGRPVSVTGTSKGRMDELISDLPNIFPALSSNEDILSFLQSGHPAIPSLMAKIEEIYGVTGDELITELRSR